MTVLRLAYGGNIAIPERKVLPHLLVSFYYLKSAKRYWDRGESRAFKTWAMDSGAYSAKHSGAKIDLQEYTEVCAQLLAEDERLTEVFALDVIGDWKASIDNAEKMNRAGVPAIPTYHANEPEHALLAIARDYPKIALGGFTRRPNWYRLKWARACFSKVWPKKIHGFGVSAETLLMAVPFHSVDATSWSLKAQVYGFYKGFRKGSKEVQLGLRGKKVDVRHQIDYYTTLERQISRRWASTFEKYKEQL